MAKIAMLGSGFIGRFYADSLQGQRSKDKIVSIYSRREESAKKFAEDYNMRSLDDRYGRSHQPSRCGHGMHFPSQ